MEKILATLGVSSVVIAIVVGLTAIKVLIVFYLWNGLVPDIFGLPQISVWQAFGMMIFMWALIPTGNNSNKN